MTTTPPAFNNRNGRAEPTAKEGHNLVHRDTADRLMGVPFYSHTPLSEPTRSAEIAVNLKKLAVWCMRFLAITIATVLVWRELSIVWSGLLPVLITLIVCTLLWPPVNWMCSKGLPRSAAVLIAILGTVLIVAGVFTAITPGVLSQSETLVRDASRSLQDLKNTLTGPPFNLKDSQLEQGIDELTGQLQSRSGTLISGVLSGISTASSIAVNAGIVIMLTFFFLKDGDKFLPWLDRTFHGSIGSHLHEICSRSWKTLGGFIRAQAIISFLNSVFIAIGLTLLHVPLAMALSILNFFAGFIPIFGAFVAGAVAVVIAFLANGWLSAVLTALLILLVHQIEGNVLSPVLQSRAMKLHPVIILASVAVGGGLYGVVGTFLAVPIAAVLAVLLRYMSEQIDLRVVDPVNHVVIDAADIETDPIQRARDTIGGAISQEEAASYRSGRGSRNGKDGKGGKSGKGGPDMGEADTDAERESETDAKNTTRPNTATAPNKTAKEDTE